jgi:type III secretory pathway lipoprotein EscJ
MEENWQKVYSSEQEHKVQIVQAVLEDQGIRSIAVNKKDRAYLFGAIELYVQPEHVIRALQIINKESL